ncbi:LysR family transcriptional regulator [Paraburkholderia sp. LEh10]|uniref:LysR family transcriptional regulator n=1 Tax=Paraburkholderia sp. LEh10 TaxID=2821353 RepID=UPI001AE39342|nr:LysR family transcriptional regulator [Paraburkholderia sp. LEh10]MBP0590616.1 LysR family transcriptional regulator [Paraburkholderia sp. LEh10]
MDRLDALRLFVEIAEAGSFSAAARKSTVSTSTVTLALQKLEEEVGARLIERTTRRLAFTYEGQRFLDDARRVLADWDDAILSLRDDGPLNGLIRLTVSNDFGRTRIVPLLDKFMNLHPQVQISLMLTDGVVDLVDQHLDLGLRNGPLIDSRLKARLLLTAPRVVCAAPSYWATHGKPVHPSQLSSHTCLILARPDGLVANWPFIIDGKQTAVKVSGNRVASDGGVLREWAVNGYGVTIKNRWDIYQELLSGSLETALDQFIAERIDLFAVYVGAVPSRRVGTLIDFLARELSIDDSLELYPLDGIRPL